METAHGKAERMSGMQKPKLEWASAQAGRLNSEMTKEPCNFCKHIIESLPSLPLSKPCDICNRVIDLERYDLRPYIICPEARQAAIDAGEKAFKVKDKVVIRDVDTRTIIDSIWGSGDACPGCGFKVPDKISIADAIKAAAKVKTSAIECDDRFPLCLNSASIVLRYNVPSSEYKFGVTRFRKVEPSDSILITKREPVRTGMNFSPLTLTYQENPVLIEAPGIKLEELKKGGKDSSTAHSRFHHSTKCNGWSRRFTEDEWEKLFHDTINDFTDKELEEAVYSTAELDYRELKDPKPKKEDISIFDDPIPSAFFPGLFFPAYTEPVKYKKMSLKEAHDRHQARLESRSERYKESILHPLQPKPHKFIDPYYKENGKTNPDYYKIDSYLKKNCGYYKFPSFYTYGNRIVLFEATPNKQPKTSSKTIAMCPHESTCVIHRLPSIWWHGVRQSIACQVYLHKKDAFDIDKRYKSPRKGFPGVIERSDVITNIGTGKLEDSPPLRDILHPHTIFIMGRMVSSHVNQTGQTLNAKKKPKGTGRTYLSMRCDSCDDLEGLLRYGLPRWLYTRKLILLTKDDDPRYYFVGFSHDEILCDECQVVHDYDNNNLDDIVIIDEEDSDSDEPLTVTNDKVRTLNVRDIQYKQVGRTCWEIGCDIYQLQNSTIWQRKFAKKFEELYGVSLEGKDRGSKIQSKIDFFKTKINLSR